MKRFVGCSSALALLVWLVAASCSNPLETTPPEEGGNPISGTDTITILDTLTMLDTVLVGDSLCADTVFISNCEDTLFVGDTVHVTDTLVLSDTVHVTDTLRFVDSIIVTDTVVRVDTVVVRDCDDDDDCDHDDDCDDDDDGDCDHDDKCDRDDKCDHDDKCKNRCEKLNSHNKTITWCLDNASGRYRLDFSGWTEKDKPKQKLLISVGGQTYPWTPADDDHLSLDLNLPADACVKVRHDNPNAHGHEIKVCLKVTKL